MPDAWKRVNLEGQGVQALNLRLVGRLKKTRHAYVLLALFPLGLHRTYLDDRRGAWAWRLASVLTVGLLVLSARWGLAAVATLMIALIVDGWRIENRCAAYNRALRKRHFFSVAAAPPAGFSGRYANVDANNLEEYLQEKDRESPSPHIHIERGAKQRVPSFNEQETLLKQLAQRSGRSPPKPR